METQLVVGYFSYPCQPDGHCTYGCGIKPKVTCEPCVSQEKWLEGFIVPDNWHEIYQMVEGQPIDLECDLCDELLGS
jgi:hypothetical protein